MNTCQCGCGLPVKRKWAKGHNPRFNKEYHAIRMEEMRKRKRDWIRKVKAANGCSVCGFREHYSALDFHHISPDDKEFNISQMDVLGASYERIISEMKKCVVVCSNHHRMIELGIIECPTTPIEITEPERGNYTSPREWLESQAELAGRPV